MAVWKREGRVRLFITHSSVDKVAVSELAAALATRGFQAFVAHEDIEPTQEWERIILRALRTCHAMLAFVTEDFGRSKWTGQEVGYCLHRGVRILSVRMDSDPFGFLARHQALTGKGLSAKALARKVFDVFIADPKTATKCSTALAHELLDAGSYAEVKRLLGLAEQAKDWSRVGLDVLERAKSENGQVYGASYGDYPGRIDRIVATATPERRRR